MVAALDLPRLVAAANALVAGDKGLLAIDESIPTCNRQFARLGIARTEHNRCSYREMIVTTPGLGDSISGVILCDETIRQHTTDGEAFATRPGERGDRPRASRWASAGHTALCQEADLVPIVEPEVLMAGEHTTTRCGELTEEILREVLSQLHIQGVLPEGMLLKTNMTLPGLTCLIQPSVEEVAEATICCLRRVVPAAVAGIVFLSVGGQSDDLATARLDAINAAGHPPLPWPVAFSYGSAIQQPALSIWDGQDTNRSRAHTRFSSAPRTIRMPAAASIPTPRCWLTHDDHHQAGTTVSNDEAGRHPLRRRNHCPRPPRPITVDPLVAEYQYGDYEDLTDDQIRLLASGWDICRDGCPHGESTDDVGMRADAFLDEHVAKCSEPVVVVTHGHLSRILAARALGLIAEYARLFASVTASISVIQNYHGERCIRRWNADAALLGDSDIGTITCENVTPTEPLREDRLWQSTRQISG